MTISLRTCVKNYVKDGQRAHDYDFTVKFWNKLLREGKMAAKNKKCNDQTLWNALCRNYWYWYSILPEQTEQEQIDLLNRKLDLIEKFFTDEYIEDVKGYYQRQDPVQWYKVKLKIKAERLIPNSYYVRHGFEVPEDRIMKPNTFFVINPEEWKSYEQEAMRLNRERIERQKAVGDVRAK